MATTISHNPGDTLAFGEACGRAARNGDVFALDGDLGAGKTHFVKGFVGALGYDEEVTSPTFTLVHEYPTQPWPIFHFDFYRLETEEEVLAIGLDEYLSGGGIVVIEWGEKFAALLPKTTRWLELRLHSENERELVERE